MDKNIAEIIKLFQEQMNLIREFYNNELRLVGVSIKRKTESHEQNFHGSNLKERPNESIVVSDMSRMHHLIAGKMEEIDKKITELIKANETSSSQVLTDTDLFSRRHLDHC